MGKTKRKCSLYNVMRIHTVCGIISNTIFVLYIYIISTQSKNEMYVYIIYHRPATTCEACLMYSSYSEATVNEASMKEASFQNHFTSLMHNI